MLKKEIIAQLIDRKKAAILQVVLNAREEMYLKEIAEKSNVSLTSTFRTLQELVEFGILKKRKWKTSTVYSCEINEKVSFLKDLFHEEFDGAAEFVQAIGELSGIKQIILHGSKRKGKANVLVIGQGISSLPLEEARLSLKEKGFELSYLTLTREQYEQMSKMGLYSGEKKVLK